MSSYCEIAPGHEWHGPYHDEEYGYPLADETALFERLVLEIMQAGLNWELILKRRAGMAEAFAGYDVDQVAGFGDSDEARLREDVRIIRNRLKITAIIENARRIRAMREGHGGFSAWLEANHPLDKADWVKLFKKTFKFTGGEIVGEFLMSAGYLPGAHHENCPVFAQIAALNPPWMRGT
ncbi:MAG: DNA-3-methyladenine glycosylase I [Alphaproteobacteria bacterium]|nr:DNA-3-methyladenine glycosylase I [Alphaproteobacteria bacterium]